MAELMLKGLVYLVILFFSGLSAWLNREEESGAKKEETRTFTRKRVPEGFALTIEGHGQRCPYCHDDLSGTLLACESCNTPFHAECCRELRRCTTVGCGGTSELPASTLQIKLRPRRSAGGLHAKGLRIKALRRSA